GMSLLRYAHTIYKYNDFVDLFFGACRYVSANALSEKGIVDAHHRLTRSGDRVVIIGGGDGVTAVTAAKLVGRSGSVQVYEGGDRAAGRLTTLCVREAISGICTIHHAVVGPHIDVYGGDFATAAHVAPDEIPDCDVMELDCEGSEVEILRSMTIRPRAIIVEIHPFLFAEDPAWVTDRLVELGYRIVYSSGHDGTEIDDDDLHKLLTRSQQCGVIYLKNGARSPAVVAGVSE
ncbi:FkbM family methyltransferase, partial [Methanocalculus sp.]|uniref:FkbM family methyltransferase n=1 Tax=Methanocalculus sp. TaxID=2004547 RepID=UPI0017ACE40F